MYEICALLAQKKQPKVRKPSGPRIKPGVPCMVYGHDGIVVEKHPRLAGWWNVDVAGRVSGFDRSAIDLKAT